MAELLELAAIPTGSAPLAYTLSELGTVDWQSAFAHYDGTGASGAWRPTLTVRSQNGAIVARVFPSTSMAAGDTADVTFIPFFEEGTSGGTFTWDQGVILLGATSSLLGWWKLDEAAAPFLDSNPYLAPKNAARVANGLAYTTQVASLLAGSQNNGALQFNGSGTGTPGDLIQSADSRYDLSSSDMSFALWLRATASASSFEGGIGGAFGGGISSNEGWGMLLDWPGMTLTWTRNQDGGSHSAISTTITAGTTYFVVATYSTVNGSKLYVNGALVGSDATTFTLPTPHFGVFMGGTGTITGAYASFHGVLNEVTVWGSALAAADIAKLYTYGTTA